MGSLVLEVIYALILELLDSLVLEMLDSLVLKVLGFLKASPRSLASFASTLFNRGLHMAKDVLEYLMTPVSPPILTA